MCVGVREREMMDSTAACASHHHTDAQVRVDTRITSSTGEVLVLTIRNVFSGLGVAIALAEAKVDDVDLVGARAQADEEVVGLDVAVDQVLGMDVLDAAQLRHHWNETPRVDPRWDTRPGRARQAYQLVGEHQDGLEREAAIAVVEEILEARAQQIHHHHVVMALDAKPSDGRNAHCRE